MAAVNKGTSMRFNEHKPRMELLPYWVLRDASVVLAMGAEKYADWNWLEGQNYSVTMGSLMRHIAALQSGEKIDPESGRSHADHIVCNAIMLAHMVNYRPDMDDLPDLHMPATVPIHEPANP